MSIELIGQHLELYTENGSQFLRVDLVYEDSKGIYKTHIEKVRFNLAVQHIISTNDNGVKDASIVMFTPSARRYDTIEFDILPDSNNNLFTVEVIEEKVHKMTLKDIEKELGRKIEIVSE